MNCSYGWTAPRPQPSWACCSVAAIPLVLFAVLELVVRIRIALVRHQAGDVLLGQLGLERLPNQRVLLPVLDLVLGRITNHFPAPVVAVESQVARGIRAHVEVLVEPHVRRHEDAALMPGDI